MDAVALDKSGIEGSKKWQAGFRELFEVNSMQVDR